MDRHDGSSRLSRQAPCRLEFNQIQQQRLFTNDVPSPRERIEHRFAMQCRWRANVDKIDLGADCQFLNRCKCRNPWQRFSGCIAPFFRSINHRDDLRLAGIRVRRPMPVTSDLTEADYRTS
jgi:hypothetical protein